MLLHNEVAIASAGSGKTHRLIEEALADPHAQVLIVTYTRENLDEIEKRLWSAAGTSDHNVISMSWFEFLLRECIKPYQSFRTEILSIRSINFDWKNHIGPKEVDFRKFYVDAGNNIYRDRVSQLACSLDDISGGKVINRLAECFDAIFIDEIQDLAGYDLDLLARIMKSSIRVIAVGDPRQSVYLTNLSGRNRQYRNADVIRWIKEQEKVGLLKLTTQSVSYRCNQEICDYADALFPKLPKTKSENTASVAHSGVHLVKVSDLDAYRLTFSPQELRWDVRSKTAITSAMNMGEAKGTTFDRVLIHPTNTITKSIENGAGLAKGARTKFYVAVTRARHSVGIVTSTHQTKSNLSFWEPSSF